MMSPRVEVRGNSRKLCCKFVKKTQKPRSTALFARSPANKTNGLDEMYCVCVPRQCCVVPHAKPVRFALGQTSQKCGKLPLIRCCLRSAFAGLLHGLACHFTFEMSVCDNFSFDRKARGWSQQAMLVKMLTILLGRVWMEVPMRVDQGAIEMAMVDDIGLSMLRRLAEIGGRGRC